MDDMRKQVAIGIALAAALCVTGRLMRKWRAASRESSAPPSIPIVRAIWPETEDIRQLAARCRWWDVIQGWGGADANQYLWQRVTGERADDVAGGRVLGDVGERATR